MSTDWVKDIREMHAHYDMHDKFDLMDSDQLKKFLEFRVKFLQEELDELKDALKSDQRNKIEDELGDVLFSIVNLSRHIDCDPESSLSKSTNKFIYRFQLLEKYMVSKKLNFNDHSLSELDLLWNKIKEKLSSN